MSEGELAHACLRELRENKSTTVGGVEEQGPALLISLSVGFC